MNLCMDCGEELVIGENWCKSRVDKKHCLCKECARVRVVVKKASDPDFAAKNKQYYKNYREKPENKVKQYEREKKWKSNNKEKSQISEKKKRLKYKYGITMEDYKNIFHSQGSCCAICGVSNLPTNGAFHLDHDHTTGKIRGILCNKCNHGLGLFMDNTDFLLRAATYLGGNNESKNN